MNPAAPTLGWRDAHAAAPQHETLSDTAIEIGEEHLCDNVFLFGEWLSNDDGELQPSGYFNPISTTDLVRRVLVNPKATDEQLAAAARELRRRYLDEYRELVLRRAERSMEA